MDNKLTERLLVSFREDIDKLEEQNERATRVIVMLAAHLGYFSKEQMTSAIKNPQRIHLTATYIEEALDASSGKSPGIRLALTQPSEDEEASLQASMLPRYKLERAYCAERSRANLATVALDKLRDGIADTEPEPKSMKPELVTLPGREKDDPTH